MLIAETLAASAEFSGKAKPVAGPQLPARAWRTAVQVVTQAGLVSRRASHAGSRAFLHIPAAARSCNAAMGPNTKPTTQETLSRKRSYVFGAKAVGDASSVAKELGAFIISHVSVAFNTYIGKIYIVSNTYFVITIPLAPLQTRCLISGDNALIYQQKALWAI